MEGGWRKINTLSHYQVWKFNKKFIIASYVYFGQGITICCCMHREKLLQLYTVLQSWILEIERLKHSLMSTQLGWYNLFLFCHSLQVTEGATVYLLQAQGSSGSLHSNHSSPARSYSKITNQFFVIHFSTYLFVFCYFF